MKIRFTKYENTKFLKIKTHVKKLTLCNKVTLFHYNDVIMSAMASQITSLTIVYLTVYSGADQRKHQSSASLAFVRVIHRWPMNSPHKGLVTRKLFPFDYVIMFRSWIISTEIPWHLSWLNLLDAKMKFCSTLWMNLGLIRFVFH